MRDCLPERCLPAHMPAGFTRCMLSQHSVPKHRRQLSPSLANESSESLAARSLPQPCGCTPQHAAVCTHQPSLMQLHAAAWCGTVHPPAEPLNPRPQMWVGCPMCTCISTRPNCLRLCSSAAGAYLETSSSSISPPCTRPVDVCCALICAWFDLILCSLGSAHNRLTHTHKANHTRHTHTAVTTTKPALRLITLQLSTCSTAGLAASFRLGPHCGPQLPAPTPQGVGQ
jgi:hypothetical protein